MDIVQEIVMKVMNRTSVHRLLLVCTNSKHTQTDISYSSGYAPATSMQLPHLRQITEDSSVTKRNITYLSALLVCNCFMFYCMLLDVHSSIAIILMGKRELVALLNMSSWCLVVLKWLFLTVPRGCLQFVIMVFPDHTHLLF